VVQSEHAEAVDTAFGVASVCDVRTTREDEGIITPTNGNVRIDVEGVGLRFNGEINTDGGYLDCWGTIEISGQSTD
jgi:hypothetical protein